LDCEWAEWDWGKVDFGVGAELFGLSVVPPAEEGLMPIYTDDTDKNGESPMGYLYVNRNVACGGAE
jgi:hypothetical protein